MGSTPAVVPRLTTLTKGLSAFESHLNVGGACTKKRKKIRLRLNSTSFSFLDFFPFIIRLDILGEKKRIFRNSETITGLKYKNGKAQSASIFSKRKYELFSKKS